MKEIVNNEIWEYEVKEESEAEVAKTEANTNYETSCAVQSLRRKENVVSVITNPLEEVKSLLWI